MFGYIYKTTNLLNNKIYIGQHVASKFEPNRYIGSGCLFKSIVKRDGRENFVCELLESCDTQEQLNEREKFYIKLYNTQDRSIGYNIADGGETPWNRGKILSAAYCKINSDAQRKAAKNVCCFSLETGELLAVYDSCISAAESLNKNRKQTSAGRISLICNNKKGHAYNYIWRFEKDYLNISKLTEEELVLEHTNPRAKKILQYTKDGNLVGTWESAAAFSKTMTDNYSKQRNIAKTVNETCTGKYKSYLGFIWKYA